MRSLFVISVAGSALFFLVLGRIAGEDIAVQLQKTPTTTEGWLFIGWLIGGPPYVVAAIFWNEHHRLSPGQIRIRTVLIGCWIGLTMLVAPAKVLGVDTQFGTGAIVGNPLSAGWVWGMTATVAMALFSGAVFAVLRKSVPGGPSADQRRITARFLEAASLVALVVTLGLALYAGNGGGLFNLYNNGT